VFYPPLLWYYKRKKKKWHFLLVWGKCSYKKFIYILSWTCHLVLPKLF
jgi:hypothetical protein